MLANESDMAQPPLDIMVQNPYIRASRNHEGELSASVQNLGFFPRRVATGVWTAVLSPRPTAWPRPIRIGRAAWYRGPMRSRLP